MPETDTRPETLKATPTAQLPERPDTLKAIPTIPPVEKPEALKATPSIPSSADVSKATPPKITLQSFTGFSNGPFVVVGSGFGERFGSVTIAGETAKTTAWRDNRIKGIVPGTLKKGPVDLVINGSTFKEKIT